MRRRPWLILGLCLGLATVGWFAWGAWNKSRCATRFAMLREKGVYEDWDELFDPGVRASGEANWALLEEARRRQAWFEALWSDGSAQGALAVPEPDSEEPWTPDERSRVRQFVAGLEPAFSALEDANGAAAFVAPRRHDREALGWGTVGPLLRGLRLACRARPEAAHRYLDAALRLLARWHAYDGRAATVELRAVLNDLRDKPAWRHVSVRRYEDWTALLVQIEERLLEAHVRSARAARYQTLHTLQAWHDGRDGDDGVLVVAAEHRQRVSGGPAAQLAHDAACGYRPGSTRSWRRPIFHHLAVQVLDGYVRGSHGPWARAPVEHDKILIGLPRGGAPRHALDLLNAVAALRIARMGLGARIGRSRGRLLPAGLFHGAELALRDAMGGTLPADPFSAEGDDFAFARRNGTILVFPRRTPALESLAHARGTRVPVAEDGYLDMTTLRAWALVWEFP